MMMMMMNIIIIVSLLHNMMLVAGKKFKNNQSFILFKLSLLFQARMLFVMTAFPNHNPIPTRCFHAPMITGTTTTFFASPSQIFKISYFKSLQLFIFFFPLLLILMSNGQETPIRWQISFLFVQQGYIWFIALQSCHCLYWNIAQAFHFAILQYFLILSDHMYIILVTIFKPILIQIPMNNCNNFIRSPILILSIIIIIKKH